MSPRKKAEEGSADKPVRKRRKAPAKAAAAAEAAREPSQAAVAPEEPLTAPSPDPEAWIPPSVDRMVVFTLDGQRWAFPIDRVQEIQQLVAYTEVPDPMSALVGMVNLRGAVVPLVDLRVLLGMAAAPYTLETPMIIARSHGSLVALAVDEVEDVLTAPSGCMQEPPGLHALASKMLCVCRLDPDLVFLLEIDAVVPAAACGAGGGAA